MVLILYRKYSFYVMIKENLVLPFLSGNMGAGAKIRKKVEKH